ncbi:hypothetical protein NSA47_00975 [Irregularibacter muris]|jgi:hypothetical protein|uniref:Uncharacterized protein n=1 Tax=Irregularibacter muris TaxID=1796619 RepID=A0AAE3HFC9_9FIRM|nr:hypothetical protein [Irregularibacter muris]MCR1897563.1 hypothetical protein [Irregularibacter muris]
MDDKYFDSLAEVVKTFLKFSKNCLREGIISQEIYMDITANKKQFIRETLNQ